MLKLRWFGHGPGEDSWHYVEDLLAEKERKHCMRHRLTVRRRVHPRQRKQPIPVLRGPPGKNKERAVPSLLGGNDRPN